MTLNINRSAGTSSIFKPNRRFLNLFTDPERFDVLQQLPINAVSLDYLAARMLLTPPDFAKIDIQGAELEVLVGGKSILKQNLIGLEVEVEFSAMYEEQPLFRQIDQFVQEELGLALWDLRGTYWKYKTPLHIGGGHKGQLIFADALYLRPIANLADFCAQFDIVEGKHKVVCLLLSAIAYGYFDYAFKVLEDEKIRSIIGEDVAAGIIKAMSIGGIRDEFSPKGSVDLLIYKIFRRLNNIIGNSRNSLGSRKIGKFWWH